MHFEVDVKLYGDVKVLKAWSCGGLGMARYGCKSKAQRQSRPCDPFVETTLATQGKCDSKTNSLGFGVDAGC